MRTETTNISVNFSLKGNGLNIKTKEALVMAIVNITPDSFYDGGKYKSAKSIVKDIDKKISHGAKIIDVGAMSSRPGAEIISEVEELRRLLPTLKLIRSTFPEIFISVDTFRSSIALAAFECGANMINDISGGNLDSEMHLTIAKLKIPYVLMHMPGNPQIMQQLTNYKNGIKDIHRQLNNQLISAKQKGIKQLIADPGFGFGKTINQNFELLSKLRNFKMEGIPLLVGISRKSMIYKTLNCSADSALNGTTAAHAIALLNGADILRVHDVKEAVECIKIVEKIYLKKETK
jgi:dihydropteroate synthase